jgi:hypothetical protein
MTSATITRHGRNNWQPDTRTAWQRERGEGVRIEPMQPPGWWQKIKEKWRG